MVGRQEDKDLYTLFTLQDIYQPPLKWKIFVYNSGSVMSVTANICAVTFEFLEKMT